MAPGAHPKFESMARHAHVVTTAEPAVIHTGTDAAHASAICPSPPPISVTPTENGGAVAPTEVAVVLTPILAVDLAQRARGA